MIPSETFTNRVRWETQISQVTKATQNSTLNDEESENFVTFAIGVERHATSSVYRGSDNSLDISSYNSYLTPKDKTESDLEAEYDLALNDLGQKV